MTLKPKLTLCIQQPVIPKIIVTFREDFNFCTFLAFMDLNHTVNYWNFTTINIENNYFSSTDGIFAHAQK